MFVPIFWAQHFGRLVCWDFTTCHVFSYRLPMSLPMKNPRNLHKSHTFWPRLLRNSYESMSFIGKNQWILFANGKQFQQKKHPPKFGHLFFSDSTGLDSNCWIRLAQDAQQEVLRPLLRPMLQRLHKEAGLMISSAIVGRATPQTFNIDATNGHI